jgi:hypothetical protein
MGHSLLLLWGPEAQGDLHVGAKLVALGILLLYMVLWFNRFCLRQFEIARLVGIRPMLILRSNRSIRFSILIIPIRTSKLVLRT